MSQEQGSGVRRGREEAVEAGDEGGGQSSGEERAAKRQAGDVLAGLSFEGPAWRLRAGSSKGGDEHRLRGCKGLLEQALECSELADVRFVFDDGESGVGGHRGLLSCVSEVFAGMFRSGMEESETGRVRVRGVSRESFRVFLEYAYLGHAGGHVGMADGREVWVLAEVYQVEGLKGWLVEEGVWGMESACSAMQYVKSSKGSFGELVTACEGRASWDLGAATEGGLRGVGVEAASGLLGSHRGNKRLWRGCDVIEGFRFAERWVRGNGGASGFQATGADIERLVGLLELSKLPVDFLKTAVKPSGLVSAEKLLGIYEGIHELERLDLAPGGLRFEEIRSLGDNQVFRVAVDEGGGDQLVATSSVDCVRIFKAEGGEKVASIGPYVDGLGLFDPYGVAFNGRGELLLCDWDRHCVHAFSGDGRYLRSIGREGAEEGELKYPKDLAVSAQGDIIVSDTGNHRVQVLREDGTFVRSFGSKGSEEGQFDTPRGVAIGADGSIIVVDNKNARVQVFNGEGRFVRTFGSQGWGSGEFVDPDGVCVLPGGQIVVTDWQRHDAQVFSWEGGYLQSIGEEGDSKVGLGEPNGVAVDSIGRLFVADTKREGVVMLSRAAL